MPLSESGCRQFNDYLGRRPYNWDKRIAKDRMPHSYIYAGMYKTETFENHTGTSHLHERVYVTRPNDTGLWPQFMADPCIGTPCDTPRHYIGYGVDQYRYDEYARDYQTPVFCLDQLNSIEEGVAKMAAIAEGLKVLPEGIVSDFLRVLTLRKAGTTAMGGGLWLCGPQNSHGNPVAISVTDNMFVESLGESLVKSKQTLLINLNANGDLSTIRGSTADTAWLAGQIGQLSMEYLKNMQPDLSMLGYHDRQSMIAGKFNLLTDAETRARLLVANPALTQMYSAADFAKGGAFYSLGVTSGSGDWLFKEDTAQMRFRFRGDLDGFDFSGNRLSGAVWIEQVQPFENVAATFGLKPKYSEAWKSAPIRLNHVYNRDARIIFVADIASINDEMKFGLARSFMGKWTWKSPEYFTAFDPAKGKMCHFQNDKRNKGYWLGEYRMGEKTIYPEIERFILALGESQPYVRIPRTNTAPNAPTSTTDYQSLIAYNASCNTGVVGYSGGDFWLPQED